MTIQRGNLLVSDTYLISMDPGIGDVPHADVLIRNGWVADHALPVSCLSQVRTLQQ